MLHTVSLTLVSTRYWLDMKRIIEYQYVYYGKKTLESPLCSSWDIKCIFLHLISNRNDFISIFSLTERFRHIRYGSSTFLRCERSTYDINLSALSFKLSSRHSFQLSVWRLIDKFSIIPCSRRTSIRSLHQARVTY